jgi:hypothetical protein
VQKTSKKYCGKGKFIKSLNTPRVYLGNQGSTSLSCKNIRAEQDKTIADVRDIIGEFLKFSSQDVNILNGEKCSEKHRTPPPVLPNINIPQPNPV